MRHPARPAALGHSASGEDRTPRRTGRGLAAIFNPSRIAAFSDRREWPHRVVVLVQHARRFVAGAPRSRRPRGRMPDGNPRVRRSLAARWARPYDRGPGQPVHCGKSSPNRRPHPAARPNRAPPLPWRIRGDGRGAEVPKQFRFSPVSASGRKRGHVRTSAAAAIGRSPGGNRNRRSASR